VLSLFIKCKKVQFRNSHIFAHSHIFKERKCAMCEFWNRTIAQLLSFKRGNVQKCAFSKFALFCTFLHIRSFLKYDCAITFICTFSKSDKKCDLIFAHFYRATKCAIPHSHISKEQQNVRSQICTFSKSKNVRCETLRMCECVIAQPWPDLRREGC